jgi:hypothetical protein
MIVSVQTARTCMPKRTNSYDDLPLVEDAIPHGAITLIEALEFVLAVFALHPEKIQAIDEQWLGVLRQNRRLDHYRFDAAHREYLHLKAVANVVLRLALNKSELRACIRDPRGGETLQLPADGWLPQEWISLEADDGCSRERERESRPPVVNGAGKNAGVHYCDRKRYESSLLGPKETHEQIADMSTYGEIVLQKSEKA